VSTDETMRDDARHVARVAAGLAEGLAYCTVLLSPDLVIEWASPASTQMVGWTPSELVGRSALDLIHPDDVPGVVKLAFDVGAHLLAFGVDPADLVTNVVRIRATDGTYRSLEMAANNQVANPAVRGYVVMLRDATDQRLTIDVFHRLAKGEPLGSIVRAIGALLAWQVRGGGVRVSARDAGGQAHVCEIPPTDATVVDDPERSPISFEVNRDGAVVAEVAVQCPGPAEPTEWCRVLVERATGLLQLAIARDADAVRLTSAAHTDALTGVWNRAGLGAALARHTGGGRHGITAALYIDLDDFKRANDRWGHVAGDAVLVETTRRLRRCMRAEDIIGRLGGDEFVAVCVDLPDAGTARALAVRVVAALAAPVEVGDHLVDCAASVGLAITTRADDLDELFRRADAALLRAKREGKARLVTDGPRPAKASG
jgi:diguanylate cyclase (GGDEF)-like protein